MKYKLYISIYFNNSFGNIISQLEELDLKQFGFEQKNLFITQSDASKFLIKNKEKFKGETISIIPIYVF